MFLGAKLLYYPVFFHSLSEGWGSWTLQIFTVFEFHFSLLFIYVMLIDDSLYSSSSSDSDEVAAEKAEVLSKYYLRRDKQLIPRRHTKTIHNIQYTIQNTQYTQDYTLYTIHNTDLRKGQSANSSQGAPRLHTRLYTLYTRLYTRLYTLYTRL